MSTDWAPPACTLPTAERPVRLAEFDELFSAVRAVDRRGPTDLTLTLAPGHAEQARELTRRETACCSFFTFTVTGDRLDVTVPPPYVPVLDALEARAR